MARGTSGDNTMMTQEELDWAWEVGAITTTSEYCNILKKIQEAEEASMRWVIISKDHDGTELRSEHSDETIVEAIEVYEQLWSIEAIASFELVEKTDNEEVVRDADYIYKTLGIY